MQIPPELLELSKNPFFATFLASIVPQQPIKIIYRVILFGIDTLSQVLNPNPRDYSRANERQPIKFRAEVSGRIDQVIATCRAKRDLCNTARPDRGGIAVADLRVETPAPWWGPWARVGVPSPPVMGRVIAAQVCIGRNAFCPESTPGKILRGAPGTRMTLHHRPDRVATSDFENSNFEFGYGRPRQSQVIQRPEVVLIAVSSRWPIWRAETRPHGGPWRVSGSIRAGYGTVIRTRKFACGVHGRYRMTLHHHPDLSGYPRF
ncbi:hypothetical protein PAPYR_13151 [Paratrimastix pyriformis]|uniref:Uncharacterized protein n=1 Tax=Paratrimastix pyriformis TaxID=342808 RepID=A0ABQ8U2Z1_9EUKA|nr:hypothetical protein PAPYR_13151 [Paratrimastix pyriformis]